MNVLGFVVGLFSGQVGTDTLNVARQRGAEDGEAMANAYADGLLESASGVLERRLASFNHVDNEEEPEPTPRLQVKRGKR